MAFQLTKPDLQRFISEQVQSGVYPSAEAAIEAAVERMRLDHEAMQLTDADVEAINRADAEIDRGEFVEFDSFAAEMRRRYPKA